MIQANAAIEGVLHLHTSMEARGGRWALQEHRFIRPNERYFVCRKCYVHWDRVEHPAGPASDLRSYPATYSFEELGCPELCPVNEHDFELLSPVTWLWEGLHLLNDGDHLTIFHKEEPGVVVWSGVICFRWHLMYTEKVFDAWILTEQEGIPKETWAQWFFDGNSAKLVKAPVKTCSQGAMSFSPGAGPLQ